MRCVKSCMSLLKNASKHRLAPETVNARASAQLPQRAVPESAGPSTQTEQARAYVLHALPMKLVVDHGGSCMDVVRGRAPW